MVGVLGRKGGAWGALPRSDLLRQKSLLPEASNRCARSGVTGWFSFLGLFLSGNKCSADVPPLTRRQTVGQPLWRHPWHVVDVRTATYIKFWLVIVDVSQLNDSA